MFTWLFKRPKASQTLSRAIASMETLETRLNFSPAGTGWQLQFADEFSGTSLDSNSWSIITGARRNAVNSTDSVNVGSGNLTLTTHTENGTHYTGFISSKNLFTATYGYWEARVNFQDSPGMWSAFWMQSPTMGTPLGDPATAGTEIDIVEHRHVDSTNTDISNKMQVNLHWDGYQAGVEKSAGSGNINNPTAAPLEGNFHLYAVQWDPTGYKFYIDGTQVWQTTQGLSKRSEYIFLSSEVQNNSWAGTIPTGGYGSLATSTTKMTIDYVHVYQKPISDIANASTSVNTPISIPFTATQRDGVTTTFTATSSDTSIVPNANIVVGGDGANRTLTITPLAKLGSTTITVTATCGAVSGSDTFVLSTTNGASFHNGDFEESPAGNGWSLYGSAKIATTDQRSGTKTARIDNGVGGGEQIVTGLLPNTTYVLAGWAKTTTTATQARIGVKNYGGTETYAITSNLAYTYLTVTFTTGASSTQATLYVYKPTTADAANFDDLTLSTGVTVTNLAPTVATPAVASPSPVTGTTTNLSVLGSDDAGEANLTYSWAATTLPAGAAAPTYSVNGTNGAKNTIATFSKAGVYGFTVTITDTGNLTTTSTVNVTVNQTLTSITVTPGSVSLNAGGTQQFSATGTDQFGDALAASVTWSMTGAGTLSATGLYTAANTSGSATVTATSGAISGSTGVTVTNLAPTVATPAAASPSPVTGTTTALSVLGADDAGEANLTYSWAATTLPAGAAAPTYSVNGTNASKNTTATFTKAGTYGFTVTITDAGSLTTTSTVNVTVNQTLTSIVLTPATVTLNASTMQQFSATARDQFAAAMSAQPSFTWAVVGAGTITQAGLFTAPTTSSNSTVTATSGGVTGSAAVTTILTLPAAPTNLTVTALKSRKVKLTWTDNAINESGYYVQTSTDGVNWTTYATLTATAGSGSTVSYTTGSFAAGKRYFRVIAFISPSTLSNPSNVVSVTV